ncbi:GWT1-domain-containing protein [Gloeophyllum trabeum ATCC 11539]|uniref:GPI-anchored wall transfer protein n=1 Tax=Gloeophyllum trabeum (strain ATCC 11539 / FP-39264 / Madison 617) TaxID=670483 RepID=S7R894_GLOTA|nr:GWT1-domain-containing protein [Gloeophyllum trabeum ATCC 11539]EPQ50545.1 GWT1-domain-containing protein [Gloeophyllum trabeum ATCC 11539]
MSDYKVAKEAFVSGMTGSSIGHVNLLSSVALVSIAIHSTLRTRLPAPSTAHVAFALDFLLLVTPLLLCLTLFANSPGTLVLALLIPTGLLLLIPKRESGTPLPSSTGVDGSNKARGPGMLLPAVTIYRAHMLLMTMLSILAVDFPVFPRALAKCETFGVSLMDLGVGSFVFSQGLVSAAPLLKDPSYLSQPTFPKILSVTRKALPVLSLGLVRVLLVKGTDYPEHVTEYGVHWNFFITLALVPVLQVALHPLIASMPISLLAVLCALAHQLALSLGGLQRYVLTAPRTTLVSANKEGIVSLVGYLAIHLLGLSAGTILLPPSPNYFRRQQQALAHRRKDSNLVSTAVGKARETENPFAHRHREDDRTATELVSYAVVWWALVGACMALGIGGGVSRRLVNLPYILWVAAYNTTFLLGYLVLELIFFPSPFSKSVYSPTSKLKVQADTAVAASSDSAVPSANPVRKAPELLEAVNRNGLVLFLLANLLTGAVNLAVRTMYTSDAAAMGILGAYALLISGAAWIARGRRLWQL